MSAHIALPMGTFRLGVGSKNPVKVAAAREAVHEVLVHHGDARAQDLEVLGFDVNSGVAAQPLTDAETRQGALARARAVLTLDPELDLAIGLEGGVMDGPEGEMYTTVWVCALSREADGSLRQGVSAGGRILVPRLVAVQIRQGGEMGPIMDKILSRTNTKHAEGLFGVVTQNMVPRQREYQEIAVMATALWWTGETQLHTEIASNTN